MLLQKSTLDIEADLAEFSVEARISTDSSSDNSGWLRKAAEEGNPNAQYILGKLYLFGDESTCDEASAEKWLSLAADQGNTDAAFLLQSSNEWHRGPVLLAGTRLLSGIARIFTERPPESMRGVRYHIDRKRLLELRRKGKDIPTEELVQEPTQQ